MRKLLLITASSPEVRRARRSRVLNFQQITMPYLTARAPAGWTVTHIDEESETTNVSHKRGRRRHHLPHARRGPRISLDAQGRILTRDWRKYSGRTDVVYQPKQMTASELLAGFQYANQRFYSLSGIARRLTRSPVQLWWTLPLNFAYSWRNYRTGI